MVDGDMVWSCNLCDHGFDSSGEMKKHMLREHGIIVNIEVTIDEQDKATEGKEDNNVGKIYNKRDKKREKK